MQLKPTDRCPGLQYLDDVDPGGVADTAGLHPGDFLLAVSTFRSNNSLESGHLLICLFLDKLQINGEDVRCASHEHVVDLIRSSGSLVTMTVVSQNFPNNFQQEQHQVNKITSLNAILYSSQYFQLNVTNILIQQSPAANIDECQAMCNVATENDTGQQNAGTNAAEA